MTLVTHDAKDVRELDLDEFSDLTIYMPEKLTYFQIPGCGCCGNSVNVKFDQTPKALRLWAKELRKRATACEAQAREFTNNKP